MDDVSDDVFVDAEDRLLFDADYSASLPSQRNISKRWAIVYVWSSASLAALGGVLFGYDVGIISGALLQLGNGFIHTCRQREVIVSSMLVGALFASVVSGTVMLTTRLVFILLLKGWIVDFCGRKISIILNSLLFIAGAMILAFSPSFTILIIGRFLVGFAVSLSAIAECIYIGEIAPAKRRGLFVSLNEFGITVGFLLAYLVNYLFMTVNAGWRWMFGLSAIPAAVQGLGMLFMPKSPRFLVIKDQSTKAEQVLQKLRGEMDVELELDRIKATLVAESGMKMTDLCCGDKSIFGRLIVGLGLVIFQQTTGQPTVLYYAPIIFQAVGFTSVTAASLATVGLGVIKVISTGFALICVDRFGRRALLLAGASAMTVCLGLLSFSAASLGDISQQPCDLDLKNSSSFTANNTVSTTVTSQTQSMSMKWLALVSIMLYVAGYAFSYGPGTWLILSEIFPSTLKGRAVSLATVFNWGTNLLVSLFFLDILGALGVTGTFLCFCIISAVACFFIFTTVPETKGRTLEQIASELSHSTIVGRFRTKVRNIPCCSKSETRPLSLAFNDADLRENENEI